MIPDWVAQYVGIPFLDHGRTRAGVDCWGMMQLVAREHFGLELRDYDYAGSDDMAGLDVIIRQANDWIPVAEPNAGDAILFRLAGAACHIGMVVSPGVSMMLHARQEQSVCVERYSSPLWFRRIEGFYRHPAMA